MSIIPDSTLQTINQLRNALQDALTVLPEAQSFSVLCQNSPSVSKAIERIARVLQAPRLQHPCSGRLNCVIVGSEGHGKNALLAEWFPELAQQGWLSTTEDACQTLRIDYASSAEPGEAVIESWQVPQIKDLLNQPDVQARNKQDNIRVSYAEDGVTVDGSEAKVPAKERKRWRFPPSFELYPLLEPCKLSTEQQRDPSFVQALMQRTQAPPTPLLKQNGRAYSALQLRAVVKSCTVSDSFSPLLDLGLTVEQAAQLRVIDTPALTTESNPRDEVLRHCLADKGQHSLLHLWAKGTPDLLVHVVQFGQPSDFAKLWQVLEHHCGRQDELAEHLLVVIHGALNPANKLADTTTEGDLPWLETGLLRGISPHGRVLPAVLCFTDSHSHQSAAEQAAQASAYGPIYQNVRDWLQGAQTDAVQPLPLDLAEQIDGSLHALGNPEDRGQRFMLEQLLKFAMRKGPALLLKKYLLQSGLLAAVRHLRELLDLHYDRAGIFQLTALQAALNRCLASFDLADPYSLERFAAETLDPAIAKIAGQYKDGATDPNWVMTSFQQLGQLLKRVLSERGQLVDAESDAFNRYCDTQLACWADRWGYTNAQLTPPERGLANTMVLLTHCLQLHGREMLYHLLEQRRSQEPRSLPSQDEAEPQQISLLMLDLEKAWTAADELCRQHGLRV